MKKISLYTRGYVAALLSTFTFSLTSVLATLTFKAGKTSLTVLSGRVLVAVLIFLTFLLIKKESFKIEKKDIIQLLVNSLSYLGILYFYWQGLFYLKHIGVNEVIFLTHPILVVFLAVLLFREKITIKKISSVVLGTLGILFVLKILPSLVIPKLSYLGLVLSFMASLSSAVYYLTSQNLLKKYNIFLIMFYNCLITFGLFSLMQSPVKTLNQLTPAIVGYILLLAVCSSGISNYLQQYAIKTIKASIFGLTKLVKPVFTITLGFLLFQQIMTFYQLVGVGLVIVGLYIIRKE